MCFRDLKKFVFHTLNIYIKFKSYDQVLMLYDYFFTFVCAKVDNKRTSYCIGEHYNS